MNKAGVKEKMEDKKILLDNIDKVNTTEMGIDRIKRNLKIDTTDVVEYCKNKVLDKNCNIYKQGKNWYCEVENIKITINSYNYTRIIHEHIKMFRTAKPYSSFPEINRGSAKMGKLSLWNPTDPF